jgi:hypothetical protein
MTFELLTKKNNRPLNDVRSVGVAPAVDEHLDEVVIVGRQGDADRDFSCPDGMTIAHRWSQHRRGYQGSAAYLTPTFQGFLSHSIRCDHIFFI